MSSNQGGAPSGEGQGSTTSAGTQTDGSSGTNDSRLSNNDIKKIQEFIARQEQNPPVQQPGQPATGPDSSTDQLQEKYKTLEKKYNDMVDSRKTQLLQLLDKKDQETYKDASVEVLEALVDYITNNPRRRGVSRPETKKEPDKEKDNSGKPEKPGWIGGKNARTGKWE